MRKLVGIIALLSIILLVSACGSSEDTRTFEYNDQGMESIIEYTFKGDKVLKQHTTNKVQYETFGVENKEDAEEFIEPFAEAYRGLNGVEYSIDYGDDSFSEEVIIDLKK